jgi:hypothetical protein
MANIARNGVMLCQRRLKRMAAKKLTNSPPSESEEQEGFVNWFRDKFPGVLIYAIPNGGHRAVSVAKRLKAEGVVAGIPDLHIPAWQMWVEMKRVNGGSLSLEQKAMIAYLEAIGHRVIVGRGATDASRQLIEHLTPRPQPD